MIALLNGHSLTKKERFVPESQPLNLAERASTTTLTVGPSAPEIGVGDWLQDETEPGAGIVWRVKSVDTQQETETRTIQLEHLINSLRDQLMFGEVKPQDMGGTAAGCTARQAVEYILARQSDWTLGSFDYGSVSNPYNFNGDDLFSALETVSSSLDGCWWSYDFSSYPFTINITHRASTVSTELRMSRNIQTARISIDRSRMYTRIYPIGKNNLHIDGNYISRNDDIYGVISKTETDQSKATKAELYRWAAERLANHCEPTVTVTVSALDLSDATGESLDHIVLGALCRLPLPGYDVIIEEIVSKISYPDKLAEPDRATVTMANIPEDVASIINNLIKSGGGGGRAAAKNAEEDHAWFVDTTDHVAMIAEGVAGEGASQDWSRVAELLVDGNGIHQRVQQAQADIVDAYSLIDQTTTAIRIEIGTVASEVRSFIETTPDMIHMEVGYAVSGFAQSVIEQTATYIRTEVQNAESAISQTVVEQTVEYVRTEVSSVASGVAWSVIEQTMTNIEQQIARKSKVYIQWEDPNNGTNVLYEGDVWIRRNNNKTWNEANAAGEKWNQSGVAWRRKYGDIQYVWKNGAWVLVKDFAADVENEVKLEQTADGLALLGHAVDTENHRFNSSLEVTARQIRSEVNTANSQVYSVIQQTATNIRAQVANEVEGLQSTIEQTASSITLSVSASKSELYSVIKQTATSIFTGVYDKVGDNFSTIEQTASAININVSSAKSSLYSAIAVTSTQISSKVGKGEIASTINQTAQSVLIQASKINLDGYVTTSMLEAAFTSASQISCSQLTDNGAFTFNDGSTAAAVKWKSFTNHKMSVSQQHNFMYKTNGVEYTTTGYIMGSHSTETIYYLGR